MAADSSATVGEVVVTGIRESLEKAIQLKKSSDDQVDVISSDDIGKLPDKNARRRAAAHPRREHGRLRRKR